MMGIFLFVTNSCRCSGQSLGWLRVAQAGSKGEGLLLSTWGGWRSQLQRVAHGPIAPGLWVCRCATAPLPLAALELHS